MQEGLESGEFKSSEEAKAAADFEVKRIMDEVNQLRPEDGHSVKIRGEGPPKPGLTKVESRAIKDLGFDISSTPRGEGWANRRDYTLSFMSEKFPGLELTVIGPHPEQYESSTGGSKSEAQKMAIERASSMIIARRRTKKE